MSAEAGRPEFAGSKSVIPGRLRGVIPGMRRWLGAALLVAIAGCSERRSVGDP
jgi:hypothetical protein